MNTEIDDMVGRLVRRFCAIDYKAKAQKTRRLNKLMNQLETQCGLRNRVMAKCLIRAFAANEISLKLFPRPARRKPSIKARVWKNNPASY